MESEYGWDAVFFAVLCEEAAHREWCMAVNDVVFVVSEVFTQGFVFFRFCLVIAFFGWL